MAGRSTVTRMGLKFLDVRCPYPYGIVMGRLVSLPGNVIHNRRGDVGGSLAVKPWEKALDTLDLNRVMTVDPDRPSERRCARTGFDIKLRHVLMTEVVFSIRVGRGDYEIPKPIFRKAVLAFQRRWEAERGGKYGSSLPIDVKRGYAVICVLYRHLKHSQCRREGMRVPGIDRNDWAALKVFLDAPA